MLPKTKSCAILCFMRVLCLFLALLIFTVLPSCAKDEVHKGNTVLSGKIFTYSDGLILISSKGVDYSYVRSKDDNYYGDYISYRERPIRGGTASLNCRVAYVDRYYVTFMTENSKITVPRYRVHTLFLDAN